MSISDYLLPREQYAEESKKYTGVYSTFEVINDTQSLFYFGANHSRDVNNPQYSALKDYWNKFVEGTKGKERIIFVEGGLRKLEESENSAITKYSEGGYITFLANGNTPIISPDGSIDDFFTKFTDIDLKEALLYKFLTYVDSFQRIPDPRPDFNERSQNFIRNQIKSGLWKDVDISLESLKELYKEIIGKDFNENESQNNFVNPNRTETKINLLARKLSDLRDKRIVNEIEKYWEEGKSIFVVFGRGHLIIETPALKKLW